MKLKNIRRTNIEIIEKRCLYCAHGRAWEKPKGIFCSRCRMQLR